MFKAALFDLDGVIFDTEPQYSIFWGSQFRTYYPQQTGLEQTIKGQTLTQIFDRYFSGPFEAQRATVTQRLNDYEQQMSFPYIAGVQGFLQTLHKSNIRTAVVTSSNHEKMARVYEQHPEFTEVFDAILTSEDFDHSKPHPDCYLKAMARFGVTAGESVVFEDSINGLRAARDSGAFVVALTTTHPAETLRALSDHQIPDFTGFSFEKI